MASVAPLPEISIGSPISGWVWPLSATPDAAFGQGLMGEGLAIDPLVGEVRAPFDGVVTTLNPSRHAVVLRHPSGLELLVHVGVDTVALGGAGFEALVTIGDQVRAGDGLLRFDLDAVALAAKSLVSPVILLNGDAFALVSRHEGGAVQAGEVLFSARPRPGPDGAKSGPSPKAALSGSVTLGFLHGLHARPAAAIARLAKQADITGRLVFEGREASVRSVAALMALGAQCGDGLAYQIEAEPEAEAGLIALLQSPFETETEAAPVPVLGLAPLASGDPDRIKGLCGAPGYAVGPAYLLKAASFTFDEQGEGVEVENGKFRQATDAALAALRSGPATGAGSAVLEAHQGLIEDEELAERTNGAIAAGKSAAMAWTAAIQAFAERFQASDDQRLRERVTDLRDVETQVLRQLCAGQETRSEPAPEGAILVADDLAPSHLAALDASRLAGVCLAASGPTAHVAIIAGSLGLPLLTSAGEGLKAVRAGEMLFLDADRGEVRRNAPPEALAAARLKVLARKTQALSEAITAQEPALTTDGVRIEVLANLGAAAEASAAVKAGAEGCGLLRTEFLFMDRPTPPTEEEQRADYQAVLDGLDGRPLVIRTLDPGGDKPIAYLPDLDEANPALGLRGVRMSLHRPDLLQTQLRAILRLAPRPLVSIMIPMVTGLGELEAVRAALDVAAHDLGLDPEIALGLMIETPASVLKADRLAQKADFFSLGTNDLTQYLLAMDRTNPHLAKAADALHPAVLRAIAMTCEAATARACKVSVCGGLASDLVAIPLLIGLGVRRLSCTVAVIPRVKQLIRTLDLAQCESLARQALDLDEADAVRKLVARQESLA